jgi:ribosomal protein S18 acetylase RimI-like enzyme
MDAWHRAIRFVRALDERGAEEIQPFSWGRAVIHRRLSLVHDANYLIADRLDGASAEDLIDAAERIQAGLGLSHRRVNVDDQAAALRLMLDFERRGFVAERFLIMAQQRPPDRAVAIEGVEEVEWTRIRPARAVERQQEPWAYPELVEQILAKQELTARLIDTRYFAACVDGKVVSSCEVRTENEIAQVETVETLPRFRGRGLARAVVSAALAAAAGHSFVFLVADHDDWPQHFYRRLGFETVGIESRFLRLLNA